MKSKGLSQSWLEVAEEILDASRKRMFVRDYERFCGLKLPEPGKDRYFRLHVLEEMIQQGLVRKSSDRLILGSLETSEWITEALLSGDREVWGFVDRNFSGENARKFDDTHLKQIGQEGEIWVVDEYRRRLPDSMSLKVVHVSLRDDTVGFDLVTPSVQYPEHLHHVEVKTSVRPTPYFEFFISRNEYEVGAVDENWVLLLVRKDQGIFNVYGHVFHPSLAAVAPKDSVDFACWSSMRVRLDPSHTFPGLP